MIGETWKLNFLMASVSLLVFVDRLKEVKGWIDAKHEEPLLSAEDLDVPPFCRSFIFSSSSIQCLVSSMFTSLRPLPTFSYPFVTSLSEEAADKVSEPSNARSMT